MSAVVLTIGYLAMRQQTELLKENTVLSARREASSLAYLAARGFIEQDDISILNALQNLQDLPGIVFAAIQRGKESTPSFTWKSKNITNDMVQWILKKLPKDANLQKGYVVLTNPPEKDATWELYAHPIFHPVKEKKILGTVYLIFSDTIIRQKIRENTLLVAYATGAFWLLGILASWFLTYFIVRRIRALAQGVTEIGKGNLTYRFPPLGSDEIGMLRDTFNKMLEELEQAQKMREEQLVLDEQIRQAQEIQQGMNPADFFQKEDYEIKGYTRAAKGVGGDYFDYHEFPDGRFAIVIADVSGKSISASLVMVLIKTVATLHFQIYGEDRPDKILDSVNRVLASQDHIEKFATMLVGIYYPKERVFVFSNGGYGPVFLYRKSAGVCTQAAIPGLPVGLDEDSEYKLGKVSLNKGDLMLFYTDGITEAWDLQKNEYGLARLAEQVKQNANHSADKILESIWQNIEEFAQGAEQHDDMTLVVFKSK